MLQNAYLVAKIGASTAENEQHFAEILPIGRRVTGRSARASSRAPRARAAADFEANECGQRERSVKIKMKIKNQDFQSFS